MPPKILYKFFPIDGAQKTLTGQSLKYAPPNSFNDPFEFMPGGYIGDTENERRRRVKELLLCDPKYKMLAEQRCGGSIGEGTWREFVDDDKEFVPILANSIFDSLQQRDWNAFVNNASHHVAFTSFAEDSNNILMWAHYAECHKGIAIGFDTTYFDRLHKVNYETERVRIPLSTTVTQEEQEASILKLMETKSDHWSYENEWRRIVKIEELYKSGEIYLGKFDPRAVLSIILGVRVDPDLAKTIHGLLCQYPNATLFQAKPHQTDFRIDINRWSS